MRELLVEDVAARRTGAIKIGPFGSALPRSAMVQDGIKVYGQENLIARDWGIGNRRVTPETFNSLRTCELHPGDVVIGMMGSLGHCEVFPSDAEPGLMDSHLLRIQPNQGLLTPEYLRYILLSDETTRQIDRLSHGSIMAGLSSRVVRRVRLFVPPLEEQRRIAETLDTIDETIQATEQVIAKLREVQEGLLQRFLPKGGLVHETADRELPEGWHFMTIDEIAVNRDGRRIPIRAEDRLERRGPYPYYGASGVIDHIDDYLFDGTYVLLGEDGENVLSRSTPLAFVVTGRSWVNNHAHVFEARAGVDSRFLALVLERTDYAGIASGSAQPKITQLGLRQMRFPMPGYQVQTKLCERMQYIENSVASEIRHAGGLEAVRAGLAADLLSGRVRTAAA